MVITPLISLRSRALLDSLAGRGGVSMDDLFLLSEAQMRRIKPHFPQSHGIARVDDRRVVSGIVFVIRNGLRWRDAPRGYGPHKTIYNRIRALEPIGRVQQVLRRTGAQGRQAAPAED
jgi:putative transposase